MAFFTKNLNLEKPEVNEYYNIEVHNNNSNKIDTYAGEINLIVDVLKGKDNVRDENGNLITLDIDATQIKTSVPDLGGNVEIALHLLKQNGITSDHLKSYVTKLDYDKLQEQVDSNTETANEALLSGVSAKSGIVSALNSKNTIAEVPGNATWEELNQAILDIVESLGITVGELYQYFPVWFDRPSSLPTPTPTKPKYDEWINSRVYNMISDRYGTSSGNIWHYLFITGGSSNYYSGNVRDNTRYDTKIDTITSRTALTQARSFHGSCVYGNQLLTCGGSDYQYLGTNTLYSFNEISNSNTTLPNMTTARSGLSTTMVGNVLYAIGGCREFDPISQTYNDELSTVEAYDVNTKLWTTKLNIPVANALHASVEFHNEVHIFGEGLGAGGGSSLSLHRIYSTLTNTWKMATGGNLVSTYASNAVVLFDKIHLLGGMYKSNNEPANEHRIFCPRELAWNNYLNDRAEYDGGSIAGSCGVVNNHIYMFSGGAPYTKCYVAKDTGIYK